jgi:PIN domain nuclease of toxin-antitoxin system
MRRVLLDTHVFYWALTEPSRLPASAWLLLDDSAVGLELSIASAWELAVKCALGKMRLPGSVRSFVADGCRETQTQLLHIDLAHVQAVSELPQHHRDPFDRMIIAQARTEDIALLSYDSSFDRYEFRRPVT